jgi:oligoendopeptidase F
MNRRDFIQTTGLTAVAAIAAGSTVAVAAETETPKAEVAVKTLPPRSEVKESDTWDLSKLFPDDKAWEDAFVAWQKKLDGYAAFRGHLGDSAEKLAECITFDLDLSRMGERLGVYAHLKVAEDQANGVYQRMMGRFMQVASKAGQVSSFIRPEILAIPSEKMDEFLASPALAPYKLLLARIIRFKPHTLDDKEERLLAMLGEFESTPSQIFHQLADTDIKFGAVKNDKGEMVELSNGSLSAFLDSPDRNVRKTAFHQFYAQYKAHEHTLAGTFAAAVTRDTFNARARNFKSALEGAMFPDNVPVAVYDNLIASVHRQLPALYHYYEVRRRKMGLKDIHFYDIYAPILAKKRTHRTWDQAVDTIEAALAPLGGQYVQTITAGLRGRWCDRYENRGKQSGAFSQGCYDGDPHILISYQPDVLDSMFTLAHEGGHSMHSYLSCKNQPYAYFDYTLFVAEVASTFNETLLSRYLIEKAQDKQERAFILNHEIDTMRATIFRQTMFADFEKLAHASAESGEPLTLDRIKQIYHSRLALYFGPDFALDADLDLECFRIPHFYRTFYVYKYATAISAAIALVDRVVGGGEKELNDYLTFLKGGCSKDPLDLLRSAGVDLEKPDCVDAALVRFDKLVKELDSLI